MIKNYQANAIHTFQVHTLKCFGFKTRVTLANLSGLKSDFATNYVINLRVNYANGEFQTFTKIDFLSDGSRKSITLDKYINYDSEGEDLLTFSLIPEKYSTQEYVSTSREELWALFTAQDHHVEYYSMNGYSSGLLYQSGAFNYSEFSKERSTIIQAPKIYSDEHTETYMSFIYNSFDSNVDKTAKVQFYLKNKKWTSPKGEFEISANSVLIKKFSDLVPVNVSSENSFACLYALCQNATLLPLTISYNKKSGALAIEHSLPPTYYGTDLFGESRKKSIKFISDLFQEIK